MQITLVYSPAPRKVLELTVHMPEACDAHMALEQAIALTAHVGEVLAAAGVLARQQWVDRIELVFRWAYIALIASVLVVQPTEFLTSVVGTVERSVGLRGTDIIAADARHRADRCRGRIALGAHLIHSAADQRRYP